MENNTKNPSLVRIVGGRLFTDSAVLAKEFGREHRKLVSRIIYPYREEIASLSEDRLFGTRKNIGDYILTRLPKRKIHPYVLNERQALLVISLMSNGIKGKDDIANSVVKAKKRVIMAFIDAREQLIDASYDLVFSKLNLLSRDIAKFYGVDVTEFDGWLHDAGFQFKLGNNWRLNYDYSEHGLALMTPSRILKFTPLGQRVIHEILQNAGHLPILPMIPYKAMEVNE